MEEDSGGRHEPPGDTGADAAEVNVGRSGPDGTEAATARGLGAGGGGGGGSGRTRRAPMDSDRPSPQDAPAGETGRVDGGGWGGHPQSAATHDLPTDADGGGGGGKIQSVLNAAAVVDSNEESPERRQRAVSGPDDAAGGVAGADQGRLGAELSTGGNNDVAAIDRPRDVQPPSVQDYSLTDRRPTSSSAASSMVAAAEPAFRAKKSCRPEPSDVGPTGDDYNYEDEEGEEDEMEQQQHDTDEGNEVQSVNTDAARDSDKRKTRKGKKKKNGATSGGGATRNSGSGATGFIRSTRRSDLNNRLQQVGVGSRVGIFWPLDNLHYPATIIATHGRWPHTYTFLYDDGEKESFDLSKHQQFQILHDEVPKAALDAIATASLCEGGDQNGGDDSPIAAERTRRKTTKANGKDDTAEVDEQGKDWVCPTCETTHPYQKKLCQCPSTRKKGNGNMKLCAIPDCSKQSQGPTSNSMCQRHFTISNGRRDGDSSCDGDAGVPSTERESSKKRARKAPDRFDGQEISKSASFDGGDHKSEAEKSKRSKSAFRSNNKNELSVDEISNLRSRQPKKKKASRTGARISRGAREDESSGADCDTEKKECDEAWICLGCGNENAPERKRCSPPCGRWRGGSRNVATSPAKEKPGKSDGTGRPAKRKSSRPKSNRLIAEQEETRSDSIDTPAMKKNPYAGLKRRDSPRSATKNQCGQCDACMIDDCGECRHCLDMKKFGGPWKIRKKCSSRPLCSIFHSKSGNKANKSRAPVSPSERTSRAGRPPRAKPVPPAPPAGSIALDPLKLADAVDVPRSTESCDWSFDENSRVLLAKFNLGSSSSIDPVHKETLLKMMERDDITVISEGLVGDLNRTLWDMHYVSNLVGDKPYHKVRRFERELVELSSDKPQSEKDQAEEKIAGGDSTDSAAAAATPAESVQVEDAAKSRGAGWGGASEAEESSSVDPRQQFHVRHKEVDKNLSMKISDYCKYLDKRSTALQSIAEKRLKKGVDLVNPASREDDLIGRPTDVEGQNSESFTFLTHDGKEETINVVDEVLYLIDYDMVKLLPPLYEDFVNKFKLPDCLPGGQHCMMNAVNVNGRPFMGPNFYVTPPASFTHFHQDGHGTVDSGHQCLSGYNEVVMLRRMPEEHKQRALYILNDQAKKKKRPKYDGLYGLPHGDGLGAKPDWPTTDAIEECRRMNYCPSVFVLKPGQFVHINKGRLHAFRKLSPTALPPNDCHRQLRLDTIASDNLGSMERLCVSVAWDWMYKGCTEKGISEEIFSTLHCARLLRGHQLQSLAIPELSVLHTAIQLVAEYEQNNASPDTKRGILPFLVDNNESQPDSKVVKEKLKGIAPAMEYIIDRHERAFKAAKQELELQASQENCRTTLDIAGLPDASENPESYALDPYGNGDFHCRLCHEELSNIYMHCDGCENILNKDYNICVSCHGDGKYKEYAQMHPTKPTKNSSVNHMGENQRDVRGNFCPCKKGKACTRCGYCSGCSCKCHQCFTMHMRFSSMDEMIVLRERVRNVVGTCSIPDILLGSPDAAASKKAVSDSSSAPGPAAASALPLLKEHAVSAVGESGVQNGHQIRSREKRAKKRNRDRQSSSSIDEEKKEDSVFGDDTFDASEEKKLDVRGRQKRSKSESSEGSLYDPDFDTGGNLKVDEDAMELDEEEAPRKLRTTKKRSYNVEEVDNINDEAIAEAMQESEYAASRNRVAKSARKASVAKSEDEDESGGRKIIDVEDGNSATLHRSIGSRHADEETGMSPSPRKKKKTARSKKDASDGDWVRKQSKKQLPIPKKSSASKQPSPSRMCSVEDCPKLYQSKCDGMCRRHFTESQESAKSGIILQSRTAKARSTASPSEKNTTKKEVSASKKKSSASKNPPLRSKSLRQSKCKSTKRHDKVGETCSVHLCRNKSIGPQTDNMCERHYENSQAVEKRNADGSMERRSTDGRRLCSVAGCPKVDDGARSNFLCVSHFRKSCRKMEDTLNTADDNDADIDETLEESPRKVSGGSEDEYANLDRAETIEDRPESNSSGDASAANIEEEEEEATKPTTSSEASDADVSEMPQARPEHQEVDQTANDNDDEVEILSSAAASAAAAAAADPNHLGRRSSSRASSRAGRSRATSASNNQTGEPKEKVDLMKKDAQSFIAPYANAKALGKFYPVQNGLTPSIVLQLLEDHEDSDPSAGMLIDALPKECGLVRDDPNHRNMIRHLYRNFQGEGDLLENKTGDKLPVSLQERDICVYATILEKGFDFLEHFIPYRSRQEVIKIYRRTEDKGFQHNEEHTAHVKRTIGLIERLEGPIKNEEGVP